ncbi:MAG: thioredoxin domain-containing protein, partial [Magnetococcales bacterium]|nr:thioredoxin domain-containing protein [Magnetococcales bacterium]
GITAAGNFEGHSIPTRAMTRSDIMARFGAQGLTQRDQLAQRLLTIRQQRVAPGRDDKLLTGWNALMIKGLLRHAALEWDKTAFAMAERALRFLGQQLRDEQGRWYGVWRDGQRHTPAFLEDHAFLLDALLEAAAWLPQGPWLSWAEPIAQTLLERFADPDGGFFSTPVDQQDVIVRPKNHFDASIPSGNGMALAGLIRLALATGNNSYRDQAARHLAWFKPILARSHGGHGQLALATDLLWHGAAEVVIAGDADHRLAAVTGRHYLPDPVVIQAAEPQQLPPHLRGRLDRPGAALCVSGQCWPAVTQPDLWQQCLSQQHSLSHQSQVVDRH